jgi:hypothetical protein
MCLQFERDMSDSGFSFQSHAAAGSSGSRWLAWPLLRRKSARRPWSPSPSCGCRPFLHSFSLSYFAGPSPSCLLIQGGGACS